MSITATVLAKVDEKRLEKAATSLRNGEYEVFLSRNDGSVLSAFVKNGRGQSYTVSLTENGGFCSCPDAAYRAVVYKHQVATAVRVIQDGTVIPQASAPNLKLARMSPKFTTSMI